MRPEDGIFVAQQGTAVLHFPATPAGCFDLFPSGTEVRADGFLRRVVITLAGPTA